ncbi:hypothetical protein MKW92_002626 [Papaver armeniacum]|nr:hypothetical protein MKW92_002626 [Papaver armeniacum]
MSSSDRMEPSVDPGTWDPMNEDMVSMDSIEFHSEKSKVFSSNLLAKISVFMGGSMGSVVSEKITRLIYHATRKSLPLIIVCASGGSRMQEGSLSLMKMAKISSASYNYQSNKKFILCINPYIPYNCGVTASFGMLGDIIIAEPNAYIAFAGKRVMEQTLNKTVPDGSQAADYLFHKGDRCCKTPNLLSSSYAFFAIFLVNYVLYACF